MRIGLNDWVSRVAWWPPGASYAADFAAGRYMRSGQRVDAATAFSFSRSSAKYAADSSGTFITFAPNVPALTAAGLSIEPASANLLTHPVGLSSWVTTMASATPQPGPVLGIFTQPMLVTDTAANVAARLRHPGNQSVIADASYALTYWFCAGSSASVALFATGNAGSSRMVVGLPSGVVVSSVGVRGSVALTRLTQVASNAYCAHVVWVPNFTGTYEIAIGPGTAIVGDTVVALGAFVEAGTRFTGPMVGPSAPSSRAADLLTLHLPAGAYQLTFAFVDGSTQVVSGASGDYLVPTDLNGSTIAQIAAIPV